MKINVWFNFCRFVIICFLFFSCLFSLPVFAAQVTVCSFGCDYTKIQDAVNAADSGDVVLVKDGTYVENINVYKSLTIKSENGADKTIVQSAGGDTVFKITTSYVTISGFKVSGWIYGIYLYNADYCNIYNNDISNDYDGIRLHNSSNNTITNNSCYSNNHCGILLLYSSSNNNISRNNCSYNHYGIRLIKSLNNNIFNNSIYSIYDGQYYGNGIDLFRSSNTVIINNSIKSRTGNYGCGISISTSSSIDISNNRLINSGIFLGSDVSSESISYFNTHVVEDNTINGRPIYYYKNTKGIKVSEDAGSVIIANCSDMIVENINASVGTVGIELAYTKNSTILSNNVLYNTKGIHSYSSSNTAFLNNNLSGNMVGIYSGYSYNNDISNNKISDCYVGVRFSYSNDNTLLNNKVSNNKYGVYLSDHSDNNIIYSNDFINNLKNTYSYSSTNIWNSLEPITYTYNGKTHTNYLGNYWDDYEEKYPDANEIDWTGIWDISYDIGSNNQDNYSLVEPFENYVTKSVLQVPFIHQVYDTPIAEYYGTWACAPTSAVMILAYYGRIEKDNIWISHPSPGHNSPYGKYIYQEYTYKEHTFSKKHTEFCVCGKTVTDSGAGAWGYIWKNSYCYDSICSNYPKDPNPMCSSGVIDNLLKYLELHDFEIALNHLNKNSARDLVIQEIDNNRPLIARTYLTGAGHYVVIVGYEFDDDGNFWYKVNDPFGDYSFYHDHPNTCWGCYTIADPKYSRPQCTQPVRYSYSQMRLGDHSSRGLITIKSKIINEKIMLRSPGELRVYDSKNRVTGLINGTVKKEIPKSTYYEENKTVILLDATDTYSYEVAGTDNGTYGLEVTHAEDGNTTTFNLTTVPTTNQTTHQYTINWQDFNDNDSLPVTKITYENSTLTEVCYMRNDEENITGNPIIWNLSVINSTSSNIPFDSVFIHNSTIVSRFSINNGTMQKEFIENILYDILLSSFEDSLNIYLYDVNLSFSNNLSIIFDKFKPYENTTIYAVDLDVSEWNQTNITISLGYDDFNKNHIILNKCDDWNFTGRICSSQWHEIIFDIDEENNLTVFNVSGFSAFKIEQEPYCGDGIKNGNETGIDCGGSCPNQDCCTNGYHDANLGEEGIDCGGACKNCTVLIQITPENIQTIPGNIAYATATVTPKEEYTLLTIEDLICKDNGSGCIPLSNPCGEISIVFNATGNLSAITDSNGQAIIKITLGASVPVGTVYRYYVNNSLGSTTAQTTAIPEFPIFVLTTFMFLGLLLNQRGKYKWFG